MKLVRHNLNLVMQSTASRKRDRNGFVYQSEETMERLYKYTIASIKEIDEFGVQ